MKVLVALATVIVLGCSSDSGGRFATAPTAPGPISPTGPPPSTPRLASLWMMAIGSDGGGACIPGAAMDIVRGERAGERQIQEPCDVWAYGGGFGLKDLTPGVELVLRFSASGYTSKEATVVAAVNQDRVIVFELTRIQ